MCFWLFICFFASHFAIRPRCFCPGNIWLALMDIRSIKISLERELWIYCRSRWRTVVAVVVFSIAQLWGGCVCERLLELQLSFFIHIGKTSERRKKWKKGERRRKLIIERDKHLFAFYNIITASDLNVVFLCSYNAADVVYMRWARFLHAIAAFFLCYSASECAVCAATTFIIVALAVCLERTWIPTESWIVSNR